ncbi:MAG: hypothetical protein ACI4RD_04680 [Kiritimatiellia bacterium]
MKLKAVICAVAVGNSVSLATAADQTAAEAEKGEIEERQIVSASASLAFDSKYLSYGFVDNTDPILTPSAEITFYDFLTFGIEAIFDLTTYGHKAGYGNHAWRETEVHPYAGVSTALSPEDFSWLPTTIELELQYLYERHSRNKGRHGDPEACADTQFWTLGVAFPDLWLEPAFTFERDVIRDNGTYVAVEIGHSFNLLGDDDETLVLRPSIAQGFGNRARVHAYVEDVNEAALMDTLVKLDLTWKVGDFVEIGGYVGYSDFLFDSDVRHAARDYEARGKWDESWNFIAGLSVSVGF